MILIFLTRKAKWMVVFFTEMWKIEGIFSWLGMRKLNCVCIFIRVPDTGYVLSINFEYKYANTCFFCFQVTPIIIREGCLLLEVLNKYITSPFSS